MALAGHDLLDPFVDGARADEPVRDHGAALADAPRPVAGLVLDGRVPPAVVEHDVVGRGQVEPGAARLQRQHQRPGPVPVLELGDEPVAGASGEAAVVARDRHAGDLGEVLGEAPAPRREVGEDEDPLAGGEHGLDDLLEPGQLARIDRRAAARRRGTRPGGCRSA